MKHIGALDVLAGDVASRHHPGELRQAMRLSRRGTAGTQIARLHVAPVCLGLGISVAEELQGGAAEEHVRAERRLGSRARIVGGVTFRLLVAVAVDLQTIGVVLQAGAQGPREVQVPQHVRALQQLPRRRVRHPLRRVVQGHGHQHGRDGRIRLGGGVVGREIDGAHRR